MKFATTFIEKITYSGISHSKNSHDRKCILIINRMSIVLALLMVMFASMAPIFKIYDMLYFCIPFFIAFSLAPYFNYRGWLTFSKFFFAFAPVICLVSICFYNSINLGDRFFFITTATIPIILFRKTWVVYTIFYVSVAAFIFTTWYQSNYAPMMHLPKELETKYWYFTLISVFAVLFYVIRYFKGDSEVYEKEIEDKNTLISIKNKEIVDSINYAKRIQYTLLAHNDYLNKNLPEHFVLFKPKDIVSGDFYWATKIVSSSKFGVSTETHNKKQETSNKELFFLAVCDSTGHGVPGAFMSLLNISFLNEAINEKNILQPHEVLNHVRKRLIESVSQDGAKDGMDGILISLNPSIGGDMHQTTKISYAAANNAPILIRDGAVMELPFDKMPVGHGEKTDSFKLNTLEIKKGETLYLYTDGFADQFGGAKGKKFKYKQLNDLLIQISKEPLEKQKLILDKSFTDWKGNLEQVDDVCIIGIRL